MKYDWEIITRGLKPRVLVFFLVLFMTFLILPFSSLETHAAGTGGKMEEDHTSGEYTIYRSRPPLGTNAFDFVPVARGAVDPRPAVERRGPQIAGSTTGSDTDIVVLYIEFTDYAHTKTVSEVQSAIFSGSMGLETYYVENSYGTYHPLGRNVYGNWLTSAHPMSYYGRDAGSSIDMYYGHPNRLAMEAVQLADSSVNFASYDTNGDGTIDHLVIVHAEHGQEEGGSSDRIWSHYSGVSISVDGKQIYDYICVSEFSPMGVVAHEYGHDLGLPDLYDTDYSSDGVGRWCLMGAGSWNPNPSHLMAWCKMELGWLTPSLAPGNSVTSATLRSVELYAEAYKVLVAEKEFFLVENRYAQGAVFDQRGGSNLPEWGLLIWHIDETQGSNARDDRRLVDLEEADGNNELDTYGSPYGEAGDIWGGNHPEFGTNSNPSSSSNEGVPTNWKIYNVPASAATVSFNIVKGVAWDLSVAVVSCSHLVPVGNKTLINATIANTGATDYQSYDVTLNIYVNLITNLTYQNKTHVSTALPVEQNTSLWWIYTPATTGRFIVEVVVEGSGDEVAENNERYRHFLGVNVIQNTFWGFDGDPAAEKTKWVLSYEKSYIWPIYPVQWNISQRFSTSTPQSWRCGRVDLGLIGQFLDLSNYNTSMSTNDPINVAGQPQVYLVLTAAHVLQADMNEAGLLAPSSRVLVQIQNQTNLIWVTVTQITGNKYAPAYYSANLTEFMTGWTDFNIKIRVRLEIVSWFDNLQFFFDDMALIDQPYGAAVVTKVMDPQIEVPQGSQVIASNVKVVNVGDFEDAFVVTCATNVSGVSVGLDGDNITLLVDECMQAQLQVTVAGSVPVGTLVKVTVTLVSSMNPQVIQVTWFEVLITPPPFDWVLWVIIGACAAGVAIVVVYIRRRRRSS